jgi:hypothetical protein
MIKVDHALVASEYQASMLLQVHDELILECNNVEVKAVAELVRNEMENAVKLKIPLRADFPAGSLICRTSPSGKKKAGVSGKPSLPNPAGYLSPQITAR